MAREVARGGERALQQHEVDTVEHIAAIHRDHLEEASSAQRRIAAITAYLGRPRALIAAVAGITLWVTVAVVRTGGRLDRPVFAWLEFAATAAALLIAMLILVTQRRDDELAERRATLTLELAMLADRRSAKIISLLEELRHDAPGVADRDDPESAAMAAPADPQVMSAAIDARAPGRRER